jgi:hypothetical protein
MSPTLVWAVILIEMTACAIVSEQLTLLPYPDAPLPVLGRSHDSSSNLPGLLIVWMTKPSGTSGDTVGSSFDRVRSRAQVEASVPIVARGTYAEIQAKRE